jgi:NAD(P)-dependent dehydrogenase (short-subunit alcohol dehydrogenase family)
MSTSFSRTSTAEEVAEHYSSLIRNKTILTTGVSPGGLGAYFVETLAAHSPKLLILAGRSLASTQKTADAIAKAHPSVQTRTLQLDLGDLKSVWEAARTVLSWDDVPGIDVLCNNAAVMACPYGLTADGLEMQFGTGHLGHFVFTNAILKKVLQVKGRVVNVSSDAHRLGPIRFDDWAFSVSGFFSLFGFCFGLACHSL